MLPGIWRLLHNRRNWELEEKLGILLLKLSVTLVLFVYNERDDLNL